MMNRFSIPVNSDPKNRIEFFYLSDAIDYLKQEVEADVNVYRMNITEWRNCAGHAASCALQWVRVNPETRMAEMVTKTLRCENRDYLEVICWVDKRGHKWQGLKRAEW